MKTFYIYSKNDKIGSKIISKFSGLLVKDLEEIPSHESILLELDELGDSIIIESVLGDGVRIIPFSVWIQRNKICYKIPCQKTRTLDEIFKALNPIWGKGYDYAGVLYFVICFIKFYLFKTPFPETNKWQSPNRFYCSEAVDRLTNYSKAGMATPAKKCSDFLKGKQ